MRNQVIHDVAVATARDFFDRQASADLTLVEALCSCETFLTIFVSYVAKVDDEVSPDDRLRYAEVMISAMMQAAHARINGYLRETMQ
ncbi:MAG: hypothetical protein ACRYGG_07770 [Janthinobacterium lividum]